MISELTLCCGTTCDKKRAVEYVNTLETAVEGGLHAALLRGIGGELDATEVLAEFVADCMVRDETDTLHVDGRKFCELLGNNVAEMLSDLNEY